MQPAGTSTILEGWDGGGKGPGRDTYYLGVVPPRESGKDKYYLLLWGGVVPPGVGQ